MKQIQTTGVQVRISMIIAAVFMALSALLVMPIAKADGVIVIENCQELQGIGRDEGRPLDGDYSLEGDIDCSASYQWNEDSGFNPIGPNAEDAFTGTFDGKGYVISGITVNRSGDDNIGLFGFTSEATIKDVNLRNAWVMGRNYVGGLVGLANDTTIQRVSVVNTNGTAEIESYGDYTGGAPMANVGGLVGNLGGGSLTDAYARTTVRGTYEGDLYYGGGLIGTTSGSGTVENAYAVPVIEGTFDEDQIGPLFGGMYYDTAVLSVFWDSTVYASSNGVNSLGNDGNGRTTSWLKNQSNLVESDWDFETVWAIDGTNDGYPHLIPPAGDESPAVDANNDKNGDGIIDSSQPYIGSAYNAGLQQLVLLEAESSCTVSSIQSVTPTDLAAGDAGYVYPAGLVDFTLDSCGAPGYTTTVTQYYFGVPSTGVVLRKFNENTGKYATITEAVISNVIINGQNVTKVTYSVTDGGELDADGEVNGTIVDPAGLAKTVLGAPNTGLAQGNMLLASFALLAGVGTIAVVSRVAYAKTKK